MVLGWFVKGYIRIQWTMFLSGGRLNRWNNLSRNTNFRKMPKRGLCSDVVVTYRSMQTYKTFLDHIFPFATYYKVSIRFFLNYFFIFNDQLFFSKFVPLLNI